MTNEVLNYELPSGADRLDRYTLATWKVWVAWLWPIAVATVVMAVVSAVVGRTIAGAGGFVAPWSPVNYAPEASMDGTALTQPGWARGVIAQLVATAVAAAAIWPFARRWPHRPVTVAGIAALLVTSVHLSLSNQWGLEPIVAAPGAYNAVAVVALWSLPVAAGVVARLARPYRRAHEGADS
jgi:hypothetical protein